MNKFTNIHNMLLNGINFGGNMFRRIIVVSMILALLTGAAIAAQRQAVLVERFTNTSCGPCYPAGVMMKGLMDRYGPEIAIVQIHVNWPSSTDPFYLYNTSEAYARYRTLYSIYSVPKIPVDGDTLLSWSAVPTHVETRLAASRTLAPITFDVGVSGSNIEIDVNVESSTAGSNFKLFAAITQSDIAYAAANGENTHYNIMRDILPNTTGQAISLASTGTQHFSFPYTWDGGTYVTEDMKIVVWIQDMTASLADYNVVSAFWTWWPDDYHWLYWRGVRKQILTSDGTAHLAGKKLKNVGTLSDNYVVKMHKDMPGAWNAALTVGASSHADSLIVPLAAGDSTDVEIAVTTSGDGVAIIDLEIRSSGGTSEFVQYAAIQNVLVLVDDDGGGTHETYYEAALDALGENYYTYDRADGALSAEELADFELVLWFTSDQYSGVIDNSDLSAMTTYFNSGGRMFMSSQDLGWFCNEYGAISWYNSYFKANYLADASSENTIFASGTGPFTGGPWELFTGDGATFSGGVYNDEISPNGGSQLAIQYDKIGSPGAGIVYDGTYRLVYFGFGWEGINGATNRRDLMEQILQYLRTGAVGVEEDNLPKTPMLLTASPNPFNSVVKLQFDISEPSEVTLDIYDVSGRKIATLLDEEPKAGAQTVTWDSDAPSGVYLARLSTDNETVTRKILLTK